MPGKSLKEYHSSQPGRQYKMDFCVFSANHRCVWYASYVSSLMCVDVGLVVTKHDIFVLLFCPFMASHDGAAWEGMRERGNDMQQGTTVQTGTMAVARTQPLNVGHVLHRTSFYETWGQFPAGLVVTEADLPKHTSFPAPDQTIEHSIITTWNCKSNLKKHIVTKWRNVKVSTYLWSAEICTVNIYSGS